MFGIQVPLEAGPFRLCGAQCCHEYGEADFCINYSGLSESWKLILVLKSQKSLPGLEEVAWCIKYLAAEYEHPSLNHQTPWRCLVCSWAEQTVVPQCYGQTEEPTEAPGHEIVSRKVEGDDWRQETNVKVIELILWSTTCAGMLLPTLTHKKYAHTCSYLHMLARAHTHCTDQKKKMKRRKMSSFVPKTYLHPALCQISDLVYFMFSDFLHQFNVNRRQEVKDRGLRKLVYRSVMTLDPFMLSRKPVASSSGSYGNLRRALCWETDFWTKKESF